MGDHRATISIKFEMHEVTTECDGMWINWWDGAADELPLAVRDFFQKAEQRSMSAWYDAQDKAENEVSERRKQLVALARKKLTDDEWNAIKSD